MSGNNTSSPDNIANSLFTASSVKVFKIFCYSFIMVVGTLGNFTIIVFIMAKKKLKGSEIFVLNLTVTDLCVCLISVPFDLIEITLGYWPFGAFMCKVIYPLQTVFMGVSVFTMLCMALERHRAIIKPLKGRKKKSYLKFVLSGTWLSCIALVSPYIAVLKEENQKCLEAWPEDIYVKAYTMCNFLLFYLFPLTIITGAYIHIGIRMRHNLRRFQAIIGTRNASYCRRIMDARSQRNLRIVKIFVGAVVTFAVCLLPFHVMFLWYDFGSGDKWPHFESAKMFAYVLLYANSMIDPFIFGALTRRCRLCFHFPRHFQEKFQLLTRTKANDKNALQQSSTAKNVICMRQNKDQTGNQNLSDCLEHRMEIPRPRKLFSRDESINRTLHQAIYQERETSV